MAANGVKIGVVGLGIGAQAHLPSLLVEGFDVVAIGARNAAKLSEVGDQHGVAGRYTDFGELLKHPGLEAVSINTPPLAHFDMVMAALDAGKHVMLEKPFTAGPGDALAMRDKARATGKTAMFAEAFRFSPARAYVKSLIDQNYLGQLTGVSITYFSGPRERQPDGWQLQHQYHEPNPWRTGRASGGGFSTGPASTFFDSLLDWFGPLKAISARTFEAHPGALKPDGSPADADKTVTACFEMVDGAWGTFAAGSDAPFGPGGGITLLGSEGSLQIAQKFVIATAADTVSGGRFADGPGIQPLAIPAHFQEIPDPRDPKPEFLRPYRRLYREFAAGIAAGTSPSPNFEDAYHLQRITNAIQASSASGAWVAI